MATSPPSLLAALQSGCATAPAHPRHGTQGAEMRRTRGAAADHEGTGPRELLLRTCIAPEGLGITCGRNSAVRQALATSAAWAASRHARQRQWAAVGRGPPVAYPVELSAVAAPVTTRMLGETKRARLDKSCEQRPAPQRRHRSREPAHTSAANSPSRGLGRNENRIRRPPRLGGPDSTEPAVLRPHVRSVGTRAAASPFAAASSRAKEGARPSTAPPVALPSVPRARPVSYVDRASAVSSVNAPSTRASSALETASSRGEARGSLESRVVRDEAPPSLQPTRLSPPFALGSTTRARADTVARLRALSGSQGCRLEGRTVADAWRDSSHRECLRAVQLHRPFTSPVCRHRASAQASIAPEASAPAEQRLWDVREPDQRWDRRRDASTFGPSLLQRSLRCAERHRRETADYHRRLQHRFAMEANRAASLGAAREAARARLREQYTQAVAHGRKH